jgi:tRNA A37 threonylcarbamoyladenosine modification protein TsaB
VAKGLALPSARPLVLVSSLDALASDLLDQVATASADASSLRLLLPCIDAGKGQVYARLYRESADGALAMGDAEWVLTPADLCALALENAGGQKVVAGGTGVDRFIEVFRQSHGVAVISPVAGPSANAIATLARRRLQAGQHDDLETAVPRYGRAPDITRPKNPLLTP